MELELQGLEHVLSPEPGLLNLQEICDLGDRDVVDMKPRLLTFEPLQHSLQYDLIILEFAYAVIKDPQVVALFMRLDLGKQGWIWLNRDPSLLILLPSLLVQLRWVFL